MLFRSATRFASALSVICGMTFVGASPAASAQTLSISCGAVGVELELCKAGIEAWSEGKDVDVEIVSTPNSSTERLALYQQILAAQGDDIDILQVDVVWPGILAPHLVDLKAYDPKAGSRPTGCCYPARE